MALKSALISLVAPRIRNQTRRRAGSALEDQDKWRAKLIQQGSKTRFGKDHNFDRIKTAADYRAAIPLRDYEGLRPYIDRILAGESDILWPGRPRYLAKTSGTTSGAKYIPITPASMPHHIHTARNGILNYVAATKAPIFGGRMIFISGSPTLDTKAGIPTGRLSGIINHEIPSWAKGNQLPTWETNCIEDWEAKLDRIVEETHNQDLRLISGIPPWVQMYYERLLGKTGKSTIKEVFPNLSLFIHGGVNYEPYRAVMDGLHGGHVDVLETYPASEGFIAYQDDYLDEGLLLNTDAGMYYEFVPLNEVGEEHPTRLTLSEVEKGVDYALIISSNAGLWGYEIGDTVRFTSLAPYKIRVSGRVKHFISAFGEHVIGKEVEQAMREVCEALGLRVREFSVAPQIQPPEGGLPYHEWLVEWQDSPADPERVARMLDASLCEQNIYYQDLIQNGVLQRLKIKALAPDTFRSYMKSRGKLGGQNKIPRLTNDRKMADRLLETRV